MEDTIKYQESKSKSERKMKIKLNNNDRSFTLQATKPNKYGAQAQGYFRFSPEAPSCVSVFVLPSRSTVV